MGSGGSHPHLHFVYPGDLSTRTGGYRYAREVLAVLARRGVPVALHRLDGPFPFPAAEDLAAASTTFAAIPDDAIVLVDGLAFGAMPTVVGAHERRLRLAALVHHPLALETGIDPVTAARLAASERAALAGARAVIVTSPGTARDLDGYGVPEARRHVALPGTRRVQRAVAARAWEKPLRLLCVATITPRKGHVELVEALAMASDARPAVAWRLHCVGSLERDPACVARLREKIASLGLGDRIELVGERDEGEVDRFYGDADVFVLASHHEGYGMVLAEAMAHGLAVVSTRAGAIPETVPPDAGLLVPPGDPDALANALGRILAEPMLRDRLAAGARAAGARLPDWDETADRILAALPGLSPGDRLPRPKAGHP